MIKRSLLLGVSALVLASSGAAHAQTAASAPATASDGPQGTSSDQATADDAGGNADSGDEIVVTAQRRTENLMTTATSASVLSGNQLANKGVANVDALQFAMPSVVVNNFGQGNDFNIRGIGKAEHNTQTTTGVITYRDGVPSFPGYFQGEPYYDVANVQVLRGPQGTIVGQNATGGAVFVNTNDPTIGGGVHGYLNANYGNYNDAGVQGAVNLPISDTLAARVAFFGERRDSFYDISGPDGADYPYNKGDLRFAAGRISLLWQPTDNFSLLSKTDFDYLDFGAYPADPYTDRFRTLPGTGVANPNYRDLFDITANSPQAARDRFFRTILRAEYDLDSGVKLRSTTGLSRGNTYYLADLDGTAANTSTFGDTVGEEQLSQELTLISPDNQRFTYLAGLFGLWNTYDFESPYKLFIGLPSVLGDTPYYELQGKNFERSFAAFGEVGYAITPNLKIDVGGRYTSSRSRNDVQIREFGAIVTPQRQTVSSDNFSYKVSLGWKVDSANYLYAFVATGFRPGGLNTPTSTSGVVPPFGPERVQSFEGGWKANLSRHVRTTVDLFYNRYQDFQAILGRPDNPRLSTELNVAGTTKIYGGEAEADITLGKLTLGLGVNVLHSELGQFYAVDPRNPPPASVPAPPLCDPSSGPVTPYCVNLKGTRQTYAPNFTFNASAQYEFDLGGSDTLTPRVNYGHVGSQWATLFQRPELGDRLEDRNIVNAQLAYQHDSWTVTAYATNLTDQHYVAALNSGLNFAGPPRQYGLKVLKVF